MQDFFTNHIEAFKTSVDQKPLCVYAVASELDHNGVIISNVGLAMKADFIDKMSKDYTVLPILFRDKDELETKINDLNIQKSISLLWLGGHGNSSTLGGLHITNDLKFPKVSSSTQIILDACSTGAGVLEDSIAYKMAQDNGCTVIASKETVYRALYPRKIKYDKNGVPKIKKVRHDYHRYEYVTIQGNKEDIPVKFYQS